MSSLSGPGKKDGYSVKKGERGLLIVTPIKGKFVETDGQVIPLKKADEELRQRIACGKLVIQERIVNFGYAYVFDISQTTCPPQDYPSYFAMGFSDAQYDHFADMLENYAREKLGTEVFTQNLHSISLRGANLVGNHEIRINDRLAGAERLSTLIHEIGHLVLHQQPEIVKERGTSQIEFEADAFCVMLQSYFDLPVTDTRKRHLANHYREMYQALSKEYPDGNERVWAVDRILSEPYRQFSAMARDLRPYICKELGMAPKSGIINSEGKTLTEEKNRKTVKIPV